LICNPSGVYKSYIGTVVRSGGEEKDARFVAEYGAKVPYAIAKAAFPDCPFDNTNYDLGEVQVRNGG
jgi:hypothetical protein